jgi:hypothetical protein
MAALVVVVCINKAKEKGRAGMRIPPLEIDWFAVPLPRTTGSLDRSVWFGRREGICDLKKENSLDLGR